MHDLLGQSELTKKIDLALETVLYALLLFMPLSFGVVGAWSEEIVILSAVALLILYAAGALVGRRRPVLSWVLLPLAVFLLVPAFQLLPLPAGLINTLAPNTWQTKTELLSQLPQAGAESSTAAVPQASELTQQLTRDTQNSAPSRMQLTFYPYATWQGLRLVLAAAAFFFVVLQHYTRPDRIKRLLTCIACVGAAVAVLTILQVATRAGRIYWIGPHGNGVADGGPFLNHNNFAQFMNFSIGAALALTLILLHETFHGKSTSVAAALDFLASPEGKRLWLLLGMIILSITAIFVSMSRGGMIAFLIAASFTAVVLTTRGSLRGRGWIMAAMALGAFVCILYLGFDAVYERLATLDDLERAGGGRWQIVKDIASAWTRFPAFGTGLGSHANVYPMFDRSTIPSLAAHAENEYAQLAEEMGLAGFIPMLIFGLWIVFAYRRNIRTASTPIRSAAYGLGFGLLAILLHSFSDFGQHLPANAFLSAAFCALLITLAKYRSQESEARSQRSALFLIENSTLKIQNYGTVAVSLLLAAVLLYLDLTPGGAADARRAEKHWQTVTRSEQHLESIDWQGSAAQYADLLRSAQAATQFQPSNVFYRHWLNVYRWRSMSRNTDASGNIILPAQAMGHVQRLIDEFADAIRLCPTFGQSWAMAGQLAYFIYEPPANSSSLSANTQSSIYNIQYTIYNLQFSHLWCEYDPHRLQVSPLRCDRLFCQWYLGCCRIPGKRGPGPFCG